MKIEYWLVAFLCFCGCTKEEPASTYLDPAIQSYFDEFAAQGLLRGVVIDYHTSGVEGIFDDLGDGVNGQCQHRSRGSDRVVVDRNYWNQSTDIEREFLIFHELGHCILDRTHLDNKTAQGECVSIMHSSARSCNNTYGDSTRVRYLDELFLN